MGLAKKLFKFTAGSATGAAVGMAVGTLFAPQRGEAFQKDVNDFIVDVKTSGEHARIQTERELAERFRDRVNDPDALRTTETRTS
jgi:gas vesicle protein